MILVLECGTERAGHELHDDPALAERFVLRWFRQLTQWGRDDVTAYVVDEPLLPDHAARKQAKA